MKPFDYDECMKNHNGLAVTRDGRKVRLLCGDVRLHQRPVVCAVTNADGSESVYVYQKNGEYNGASSLSANLDLFTPEEEYTGTAWLNIYPGSTPGCHATKKIADNVAGDGRVACIEIAYTVKEGEGL